MSIQKHSSTPSSGRWCRHVPHLPCVKTLFVWIQISGALWWSSPGYAAEPEVHQYTRSTLRIILPLQGLDIGDNAQKQEVMGQGVIWGAEASYRWRSGLTMETNFVVLTDAYNSGNSLALRAGYSTTLHDHRSALGYIFPFAGYRYAERPDHNNSSRSDFHHTHNVHGGVGYGLQMSGPGAVLGRITLGVDGVLVSRFRPYSSASFEPSRRSSRYNMFVYMSWGFALTSPTQSKP